MRQPLVTLTRVGSPAPSQTKMEACKSVEREVDKLLTKYFSLREHGQRSLKELINSIQSIKRELEEGMFCCKIDVDFSLRHKPKL